MSKQFPSYLKLVTETPPPARRVDEDLVPLAAVCDAFAKVTGYTLAYGEPGSHCQPDLMWSAPVNPGVGVPPGLLRLLKAGTDDSAEPAAGDGERDLASVKSPAMAVEALWRELLLTRQALWAREAELATSVPVQDDGNQGKNWASRLEGVLRGGVEAVGCHGAALYLLDDATSELKLRASWGLPRRRLTAEARPLCEQLADLEAMLGHAVVLNDPAMFGLWRVPEQCAAAVCVPVSSASMPLGTLWVFSQAPREFSDADTNLFEVIAGRLAADLEREVLIAAAADAKRTQFENELF